MTLKEKLLNVTQSAKGKVENISKDLEDYQKKRRAKNEQTLEKLRIARSTSLPLIHQIAEENGMDVEELDTGAYVSKGTKGTHLPYGLTEGQIRAKLEATLYRSATVSKITKGIKGAVNTVNQGRDALRKSNIGKGSMYTGSLAAEKGNPVQRQSLPAGWGVEPGIYGIKVPGQGAKTLTPPGFQELPDMFRMKLPSNAEPRKNSLPAYMTEKSPYKKIKTSGKKKKKSR